MELNAFRLVSRTTANHLCTSLNSFSPFNTFIRKSGRAERKTKGRWDSFTDENHFDNNERRSHWLNPDGCVTASLSSIIVTDSPSMHRSCVTWKRSYLCSSVGLAKAALEAINGFNLFGNQVPTFTPASSLHFLMSEDDRLEASSVEAAASGWKWLLNSAKCQLFHQEIQRFLICLENTFYSVTVWGEWACVTLLMHQKMNPLSNLQSHDVTVSVSMQHPRTRSTGDGSCEEEL